MADFESESPNNCSKKTKNNSPQTLTLFLPDHILIEEILARLPVKSLIRFKSVCKYWLFMISSRKFAEFHLKYSSLRPQFLFLSYSPGIYGKNDHLLSLPYNECCNVEDLVELGCEVVEVFPILVGSCNGLVCLVDKEEYAGKFVIWNPATKEYRDIDNPKYIPNVLACGFGYVSSYDDYKIAAAFGTRSGKFRGFYVFSLRSGNWTRIVGKYNRRNLPIAVTLEKEALLIDDTLYWAPRSAERFDQYYKAEHIIGFDLVSKKFEEIPLPNDSGRYCEVELYQFKGNLTFRGQKPCNYNNRPDVWDFWMLKEVDETNTWEKLFTVDLSKASFYNFSKTDKCLVRHFKHFKLIDPCKEALEQVRGKKKHSDGAETNDYIESLVSPFATTESDEEDESYETAIHPIMDRIHQKILLKKRVPVSQIQIKKSDHEDKDFYDDDCNDGSESDLEGDDYTESDFEDDGSGSDPEDDGSGSDLEDDGEVNKYWVSSDDADKDSDYFKYALSDEEDEDDDDGFW